MNFTPGGPTRYEHQRKCLQKMIDTQGVTALLLDPGMGKTVPTLDFACILALLSERGEARVFVTGPLAVVDSWVAQARKWISPQVSFWVEALGGSNIDKVMSLAARGGRPYPRNPKTGKPVRSRKGEAERAFGQHRSWSLDVSDGHTREAGPDGLTSPRLVICVTNLESLRRRDKVGSRNISDLFVDAVNRFDPDLVVVDESHKIKGDSSNSSRLMARIGQKAKRRVILTGTPMPHSPLDLYAQWRFLEPTAFGALKMDGTRERTTMAGFKRQFAEMGGFMNREVVRWKNQDRMKEVMAQNAISFKKEEALDLPPTQDIVVPVHLGPKEREAYNTMKRELAAQIGTEEEEISSAQSKIVQRLRLRQITAGHLPSDEDGEIVEIGTSKADTVTSLVQDVLTGESRIVVFGYFKAEMKQLEEKLSAEKGTTVYTITGGTPKARRLEYRQHFGSDDPRRIILLAQISTISLSVNELVTAQHAVFATLSERRDEWVQARDRLNRIGQKGAQTTFWYANAPGTVDDVLMRTHQDRTSLEQSLLEHIRHARDL